MRVTFLTLLSFLSWNLFPLSDLGCLVSQLILLLLAWLPLQFWRDQSRDLPWSVHHVIFLCQSLLLPLSLWAFYCGLQGPLPLESLSDGSRFRRLLQVGLYGALIGIYFSPFPVNFSWLKRNYSFHQRLEIFLNSFPTWDWKRGFHRFLELQYEDRSLLRFHGRIDRLFRLGFPLLAVGLALGGVFHGDLRGLLWGQMLQLLSFFYLQLQGLLTRILENNLEELRSMLRVQMAPNGSVQEGKVAASDLIFTWREDFTPLGQVKLEELSQVWLFLQDRKQTWRAWSFSPWLRVLFSLRVILVFSLLDFFQPRSALYMKWPGDGIFRRYFSTFVGRVKNKSAFIGTEYKEGHAVVCKEEEGKTEVLGHLTSSSGNENFTTDHVSSSNFKGENKDQYIRIYSSNLRVDASEVERIEKLDGYAKNNREKIDSLVVKRRSGGAEIGESKSNNSTDM